MGDCVDIEALRRPKEKSQQMYASNRVVFKKKQNMNLEILSIDCEVHVETVVKYRLKMDGRRYMSSGVQGKAAPVLN